MPVQLLTDEQARRYGTFQGDPSSEQLPRFFEFDPAERASIGRHRSDTARLGYAVQLGSVRFVGRFPDLAAVPDAVVDHVARTLDVGPAVFAGYAGSRASMAHAAEIRTRYGYTPFGEGLPHWRFLRWLYERVWTGAERPTVLVDLSTAWLVENRVLLPGITTLTRLVARVRDRAARRSWGIVVGQLREADRRRLEGLLEVEPESGLSVLERLRRPPRSPTIEGLVGALERLGDIQRVAGERRLRLEALTPGRVRDLDADAAGAKAQRSASGHSTAASPRWPATWSDCWPRRTTMSSRSCSSSCTTSPPAASGLSSATGSGPSSSSTPPP